MSDFRGRLRNGGWKRPFIFSLVFSLLFAYLFDLIVLQAPRFTRREALLCLLVFLLSFALSFLLLHHFFLPAFSRNPHRLSLLLASALLASLTAYLLAGLLFDWRLVSPQSISLQVLDSHNSSSSGFQTNLLSFQSNYGVISFNDLNLSSGWQRTAKSVLENANLPGESLSWSGRPGAFAKLTFATSPQAGKVQISSAQTSNVLDLYAPAAGETSWQIPFTIPLTAYLPPLLAIWLLSFCIFLFLSVLVLPFSVPAKQYPRYSWLLFTLPMLAVWSFYLLTFWPGEMSTDSINQWGQMLSGAYTDAHPALYAFVLLGITRVWFSPAAVALVQIVCLALAASWGLKVLLQNGLNLASAWLIAILFALSPLNSTMVITLWKDIPYSICLLIFSIQFLQIIFTDGKWLLKWLNALALALSGLGMMLFRQNGLPVPAISLLIAILFFRHFWRRIGLIILATLVSWAIIHGPIYGWIGVEKNTGFENAVFIHHIAAHVVTGGNLTPEERSVVNLLLPEEDWQYDCCNMLPTYNAPGFDETRTIQYSSEIQKLFLDLAIKEPQIELHHDVCMSDMLWNFNTTCGARVSLIISQESQIAPNGLGIRADSKLPEVNLALKQFFATLWMNERLRVYWFPVVYLILILAASVMAFFWLPSRKALFFAVPSLAQTAILFLVNVSGNSYRYQYGICLVGTLSIGLILLALNRRFNDANQHQA